MTEAEMEAVIEDMEQAEDAHEDAQQIAEDGGVLLYSMDTRTTARKATGSGSQQRTGSIRLDGDSRNYITLRVPENVTFHNESNGIHRPGETSRFPAGPASISQPL